jgi:hypothetical protein
LSELATTINVFLSSPSNGFVSACSNTVLDVWPYFLDSRIARWALVSFVEATIFMVFVIFSMLRIDLSLSSISRSVAKVLSRSLALFSLLSFETAYRKGAAAFKAGRAARDNIILSDEFN